MSNKRENRVSVSNEDVQDGHRLLKKILEIDRAINKGISKKVKNPTVAKRLVVAGMDEEVK